MSYERLAELYDSLTYDEPSSDWFSYITTLCRMPSCVLEYACGTGRITEQLIRAGIDTIAVDASEEMLNVATRKLRPLCGRLQLVHADMRSFRLERCVELALCVCDGVNYLTKAGDLKHFFQNAHDNLCEGGCLLFDISSAYKLREVIGSNFFYDDGDETTLFWQNIYHDDTAISEMSLTLFEAIGNIYKRHDEVHYQKAWTCEEITEALRAAGFIDIEAYAFGTVDPCTSNTERIQFTARKC